MYRRTSRRRNEDVVRAILGKPVATSTCSKKHIKFWTGCAASETTYHEWSYAKLVRVCLKKFCGGERGIGSVVEGIVGLLDEAR
jgi:hypothetical protein